MEKKVVITITNSEVNFQQRTKLYLNKTETPLIQNATDSRIVRIGSISKSSAGFIILELSESASAINTTQINNGILYYNHPDPTAKTSTFKIIQIQDATRDIFSSNKFIISKIVPYH